MRKRPLSYNEMYRPSETIDQVLDKLESKYKMSEEERILGSPDVDGMGNPEFVPDDTPVFHKGDRVKLSEAGLRLRPYQSEGSVVGRSRDGNVYYVIWDGLKSRNGYHFRFLELL